MTSARTYSGRQLRYQWTGFLRENRRLIGIVVAIEVVAISGVTALFLRAYGTAPLVTYVLGAVHAATLAIFYFTLRIVFLANDQDAVRQMRGDLGETNTRDELKRAKRRRLIWGWVDSITVSGGDIDHLVVTRHGGIVAIDSKWRNDTIGTDIARAAISASKAAGRAKSVLRHLGYFKRQHTARRRADDRAITVTPLVALWGPVQRDVPSAARVEDVDFVAGPRLCSWLRQHRCEDISRQAAKQLLGELEEFRRQHQHADRVRDSPTNTQPAQAPNKA
jgi:hypothetical protein